MFWADSAPRGRNRCAAALLLVFCIVVCGASREVRAEAGRDQISVWLVTYGPGEIYWQRFGHNGIWIRDADLGLDHVFNFGFFDFEQQGFFWRFLQGRLLYFSAAQPAQQEFAQYIDENRSIRAQRLALTEQQALGLTEYLVNEVQPENRDYLYDYYWNNCSTRVRDALDQALGGAIRDNYEPVGAVQNMRDQTRRLTIADYWLYLGLELGLGSPVDRPISRWDEFFIPSELADGLAQMQAPNANGDAGPLVREDVILHASSLEKPPSRPAQWWPRYLALAAAALVAAAAISRLLGWLRPLLLARLWLLVSGIGGIIIVYLWFFTDHAAARYNLNLALLNPLWLLCLVGSRSGFNSARLRL